MNNKISLALIALLTSASAYLFYQNTKLKKQVAELSKPEEAVTITPIKPTDPRDVSPFERDHTDPTVAEQLPPETPPAKNIAALTFETRKHDFGRINEGEKVNTLFKFKNTGKFPLVISNAEGSCGCTVPEWPHQPIAPGETGNIKVTFNSEGKGGQVEKTVTLSANTLPTTTVLTISSTIIPKDR